MKTILNMYLLMMCQIVFPANNGRPEFEIRKVKSVRIEKSWKNLTGTAQLQIGSRWYFQDTQVEMKEWIRRDDPIQIYLGYGNGLNKRFEGFVSEGLKPGFPLVVTCEDYMYLLKQTPVANQIHTSIKLRDLLTSICPSSITVDCPEMDLGTMKVVDRNVGYVLKMLKDEKGLVAYFKGDKTLFVGKVYTSNTKPTPVATFHFQRNIKRGNLEYTNLDDTKLNVRVTIKIPKAKDVSFDYGPDADGQKRTLHYFNISEEQARINVEADIAKMKQAGFKGTFDTFGIPHVEIADVISLVNEQYPEMDGNYFVDGTLETFDRNGYQNTISIGSGA